MSNTNYTVNTNYEFHNNCCELSDQTSVVGVYPQNKIENVLNCLPSNANSQWVQFFIPEIVDIPAQKPDMESIVSVQSCVEIISQRVIKTPIVQSYTDDNNTCILSEDIRNSECTKLTGRKLIIEGLLKQKVIYTALRDEQSVHSAHYTIPFSVFVIVDKDTALSQNFRVYPYIEDIFTCKLSERSLFKNTTIFIKASKIC